ncbi:MULTISPECIES: HD domain-containing protein [unclassified Luteococcus]|uniref:HD domain-containing protein n=1 Tax=unclassified Luteococcus TaxID=2639923 RepID=UPI00313B109F
MPETIAGIQIPDSSLATAATELVRDACDDVVFHHSRRVFLWASLRGQRDDKDVDPELLYVAAMFHDLGLTDSFGTQHQRFEIDGADEARRFLTSNGIADKEAHQVWTAIALHTTPEIPLHMEPVVALLTRGVELDVLGIGYDQMTSQEREAVVAAHPRPDFKNQILRAFTDGLKDRPETTFGNVKADVLQHYLPGFERGDFVETILNSQWSE